MGALLRPVQGQEPVQAEQRQQDHGGVHRFAEMRRFVGVRRLQLGHQDPEDVEEEAEVGQNTEQPRNHVDPLDPGLGFGRQGPTLGVVQTVPEHGVDEAGKDGQAPADGHDDLETALLLEGVDEEAVEVVALAEHPRVVGQAVVL